MRSDIILSIVSILAHQAAAGVAPVDALSHGSYVASKMRRKADVNLNSGHYLKRHVEARSEFVHRQTMPTASSMSSTPSTQPMTGPVNLNPMMKDTEAACGMALMGANATDDSGMAACFNVNFFDNSTGFYQANVLLYQVAPPKGSWASIQAGGIELSMYFEGASANMQPMTAMKKRDDAALPAARELGARADEPTMVQSHTFLGTVSAPFNKELMNTTAMRKALTPAIMISAMTTNNQNLTTNVTAPAQAAFVNGYFSEAFIAEKDAQAKAAANPPPFVLPGVTLGIDKGLFPIGLIVVSIWTLLFVSVLGYGTLGRAQWRSAYRAKKPNASGK